MSIGKLHKLSILSFPIIVQFQQIEKKIKKLLLNPLTRAPLCGIMYTERGKENPTKPEREKTMRTIRYSVINKETKKAIYTNCNRAKCEEYLAKMDNAENFAIGYKWLSI